MKIPEKIYRFFAALTLLLFVSSIVVPAGLSAATLFCDMGTEMTASVHAMPIEPAEDACCAHHHGHPAAEEALTAAHEPCSYQQICDEAVSGDQAGTAAVTPAVKTFAAAFIFAYILPGDRESSAFQWVEPGINKPRKTPPIFLLNSTFLN